MTATRLLPPAPRTPPAATAGEWREAFTDRHQCVAVVRAHARAFLVRAHLPRPLCEDASANSSPTPSATPADRAPSG
ncbi:hypothetical protein [Kitasatospora sp. NPDC059571]|uniref:hypothetical protein n=1 Tax=Kitasatospora sp. NPDC059571 TaxID=3346871 RepID=UPI0036757F22